MSETADPTNAASAQRSDRGRLNAENVGIIGRGISPALPKNCDGGESFETPLE